MEPPAVASFGAVVRSPLQLAPAKDALKQMCEEGMVGYQVAWPHQTNDNDFHNSLRRLIRKEL